MVIPLFLFFILCSVPRADVPPLRQACLRFLLRPRAIAACALCPRRPRGAASGPNGFSSLITSLRFLRSLRSLSAARPLLRAALKNTGLRLLLRPLGQSSGRGLYTIAQQ